MFEYTPDFEEFWRAYPKKVGKGAAWKSWKRLRPDQETQSDMIRALENQSTSNQWQRERGRFIPNPAAWLNQHRWEDEPLLHASSTCNDSRKPSKTLQELEDICGFRVRFTRRHLLTALKAGSNPGESRNRESEYKKAVFERLEQLKDEGKSLEEVERARAEIDRVFKEQYELKFDESEDKCA